MQHVMNAELSNPSHPEYGVATIPFPIPDEEYQHCLDLMAPLEIGGVTAQDCKVEQINGYLPSLKRLEGTNVNLDELDILAHILDMKIDDGEDFEEATIVQITGLEKLSLQNIPIESMDVGQLNGFADEFTIADETQDRDKLRAALELEKLATLDEAVGIILHLENYVMVRDTYEEYGRKALLKLTGDQEVVDTVDGYIDWNEFGEKMMEEDGVVQTGCGMIRRVNGSAPEQEMGGFQQSQSPFL